MFSTRSIRRQTTAAGGNAEASIPRVISIVNSFPHMATEELHEQESDDVGDGSSLSCHGIQWKAVDAQQKNASNQLLISQRILNQLLNQGMISQ